MKLSFSRIRVILVTMVAGVSLFILVFLYALTFEEISKTLSISKKLMHANDIEIELERLISQLKYAESSQRGFIITHDSSFLKPFQKSKQRVAGSFATLKKLLANDETQLLKLFVLEKLVNTRYNLLFENMSLKGGLDLSKQRLAKVEYGSKLMESSINMINQMITFQHEKLKTLERKHYESIVRTPIIYLSIVLITMLAFSFLLLKMNANRKKLIKINDELTLINQSFAQAEEIAELGNWRYNFQDNNSIYSDNFYALLGLAPHERELNLRFFLHLVYPDDRNNVLMEFKRAFRFHESFILSYRIFSKDNNIKHLKSIGRIITDTNGLKFLICINMDITELVLSNKLLELKNKKLEAFNTDLASFNYVASHDLQAPLRKIQMFISRINEIEAANLSDIGKDYFNRIHSSAAHMQVLINDLLMFSRTNASNKRFEVVNLGVILNNAIDELALAIDEKNASIFYDHLPDIQAIPYQIQQLFINLISNSLKFSKKDVKPEIRIVYEIVNQNTLKLDEPFTSEHYYKITFSDNGIGFEKHYSKKIFNLLFRLHDKSEFPGSGIGLAICKKIVENHFGFIAAESEPDNGAKFFIYLPCNLA